MLGREDGNGCEAPRKTWRAVLLEEPDRAPIYETMVEPYDMLKTRGAE